MKIECTDKEKEILLDIFVDSGYCHYNFMYCSGEDLCRECIEKHIEWEIKE